MMNERAGIERSRSERRWLRDAIQVKPWWRLHADGTNRLHVDETVDFQRGTRTIFLQTNQSSAEISFDVTDSQNARTAGGYRRVNVPERSTKSIFRYR
jgi:hypothetical protein